MLSSLVKLYVTFISLHGIFGQEPDYSDNDAQVLILGGGSGGLHAAEILLDNDIQDFIVLEGDSRAGGMIKLVEFSGLPLEAGITWGYPPVKPLLDAFGLEYHESNFDSYVARNDMGNDVTSDFDEQLGEYENAKEAADVIAEDSADRRRLDVSQKVGLAMGGWISSSPLQDAVEWYEIDFEYGRPSRQVSLVGPYEQGPVLGSDSKYYVTDRKYMGGIFQPVIDRLDEDHLRFNKVVRHIDHSGERVVVTLEDGTQYTADYVLVTFSVGVLQNGEVTFTPELPPWKTEQICRFQRATLDPIFLKFPSKFWEDEEWIIHVSEGGQYPVFMNAEAEGLYPAGSNLLIGFVAEEEAVRVEGLSDDEVQAEVLGVLRDMYGEGNVPDLDEFHMERWATNPLAYGTRSTWPIPANVPSDSMERLQANVGRVFFSNDAANEFIGTVSGAVFSSDAAMNKMLACLAGSECPEYEPQEIEGCVLGPRPGKTRKNFAAVP